jgi:hypothetical protein
MENSMNKGPPKLRLSAKARKQIEDLIRWRGEAETTGKVEAAISETWQSEDLRRAGDASWVVHPGAHRFPDQASALRWLRRKGAVPVNPEGQTWVRYDEEGVSATYVVEPVAFETDA